MAEDLCDLLGLKHPVMQAGLGGGLSRAELAAAVSRAGGLGTIGTVARPASYGAEIRRAKELAGPAPIAGTCAGDGFAFTSNMTVKIKAGVHVTSSLLDGVDNSGYSADLYNFGRISSQHSDGVDLN